VARTPKKTPQSAADGQLAPFEGRDVLQTSIKVTNAGDGLSDAMAVDPDEYHLGDTVHVVLECIVGRVDYVQINGVDALRRVHTLKAGTATVVDAELVKDVLDAQRLAIEKAKGVARLPFVGDGEEPTDDDD
jgi:hypothetical protein